MATFEVKTRSTFEVIHLVEADTVEAAIAAALDLEDETVYVQKHIEEVPVEVTAIDEIWWTDWQLKQYKEGYV